MDPRLKTGLWVAATLRQADLAGRPGAVLRRGDADAGQIVAVLRGREGLVVLSQTRRDGRPAWLRATGAAPVSQAEADAYVARQAARDPDLWVVEFETPDFTPPFSEPVLPP